MFVDKLLTLLIYPFGLSLLLGFSGLLLCALRYRKFGFGVVTSSLVWLTLWALPPVADVAYSGERERHFFSTHHPDWFVTQVFTFSQLKPWFAHRRTLQRVGARYVS